jgi:hypothetical protein
MTFYEDLSPYTYWDGGESFTDMTTGYQFLSFQPGTSGSMWAGCPAIGRGPSE